MILTQCVKKAVSDSMELVDLAVKRVNFGLSLPDGQVRFFGNSNCGSTVINPAHQKCFPG